MLNRRELLRAAIGSSAGLAFAGLHRACLAAADLDAPPANRVLDGTQREMLAALADLIIPATDTPGAVDAGVPQFVELILSDWHTAAERQPLLDGLAALDANCREKWGTGFAGCTHAAQAEALAGSEESEMFGMLKTLVVNGYITSEAGATSQAGYNPMPGVYREVVYDAASGRWA